MIPVDPGGDRFFRVQDWIKGVAVCILDLISLIPIRYPMFCLGLPNPHKKREDEMSKSEANGTCLCRKVSYSISGNLGIFQYCHCSRCRKFTGSAFASNLLVAPEQFRWISGEEYVGRFVLEEARHFATSFCKSCGSSLPWMSQSGKAVIVPAGTLDTDPGIRPVQNIFCASRAVWYTQPDRLPRYEELPAKDH